MSRIANGFTKMAHGTMGGQSRVATPAGRLRRVSIGGGSSNPCECLLWRPINDLDELDESIQLWGYGGMTIIGDRIYSISTDFASIRSVALSNGLDITDELSSFLTGYLTADSTGRVWLDGYLSGIDVADPNGTFPYCIRPLDDPANEASRLITEHLVASGDQVANTFYRSVPRWLGWHPTDENFYWWQQWNMPTGSSPRYNEGRMVQVTPGGVATTVFTIGPRTSVQGFSLASEYRKWVPTRDGGLWCAYRDPIIKGDYWLRRYNIYDWSYQDFTGVDMTGADLWPTPGASDSVTTYDYASTWPTPFKFQVVNSSGTVSESVSPCEMDDFAVAAWSPMQDTTIAVGWDYDLPEPYSYFKGTYKFLGGCPTYTQRTAFTLALESRTSGWIGGNWFPQGLYGTGIAIERLDLDTYLVVFSAREFATVTAFDLYSIKAFAFSTDGSSVNVGSTVTVYTSDGSQQVSITDPVIERQSTSSALIAFQESNSTLNPDEKWIHKTTLSVSGTTVSVGSLTEVYNWVDAGTDHFLIPMAIVGGSVVWGDFTADLTTVTDVNVDGSLMVSAPSMYRRMLPRYGSYTTDLLLSWTITNLGTLAGTGPVEIGTVAGVDTSYATTAPNDMPLIPGADIDDDFAIYSSSNALRRLRHDGTENLLLSSVSSLPMESVLGLSNVAIALDDQIASMLDASNVAYTVSQAPGVNLNDGSKWVGAHISPTKFVTACEHGDDIYIDIWRVDRP